MCHIWSQWNSAEIIDVCCGNALQGVRFGHNGRNVIQENNSLLSVGNVGSDAEWSSSYRSRDFNFRRVSEWNMVRIWRVGLGFHVNRVVWELVPNSGDKETQQAEFSLDSENTNNPLSSNQGTYFGTLSLQREAEERCNKSTQAWYTTQTQLQTIMFTIWCYCYKLPTDGVMMLAILHKSVFFHTLLLSWFSFLYEIWNNSTQFKVQSDPLQFSAREVSTVSILPCQPFNSACWLTWPPKSNMLFQHSSAPWLITLVPSLEHLWSVFLWLN